MAPEDVPSPKKFDLSSLFKYFRTTQAESDAPQVFVGSMLTAVDRVLTPPASAAEESLLADPAAAAASAVGNSAAAAVAAQAVPPPPPAALTSSATEAAAGEAASPFRSDPDAAASTVKDVAAPAAAVVEDSIADAVASAKAAAAAAASAPAEVASGFNAAAESMVEAPAAEPVTDGAVAVLFYAAILALSVVTGGIAYLSFLDWQDERTNKQDMKKFEGRSSVQTCASHHPHRRACCSKQCDALCVKRAQHTHRCACCSKHCDELCVDRAQYTHRHAGPTVERRRLSRRCVISQSEFAPGDCSRRCREYICVCERLQHDSGSRLCTAAHVCAIVHSADVQVHGGCASRQG